MPSYLVTGAGRGLGYEFVDQLSSNPLNVVFGVVRKASVASKLVDLASQRANLHIVEADISDVPSLKVAAASVSTVTGGSLDILINNAAYVEQKTGFFDVTKFGDGHEQLLVEDMNESIKVNVIAVIFTINVFLPLLRKGTAKKVINISTGVADVEMSRRSGYDVGISYSASKAALNLVNARFSSTLKDEGFVFLAISPGLVNTRTSPPSEEEIQAFAKIGQGFKAAEPDWNGMPITPYESVTKVMAIVDNVKPEASGSFISHTGTEKWL